MRTAASDVKRHLGLLGLLALLWLPAPARAEQTDSRGCSDHPAFTRMPTYWIHSCTVKEFDAHPFPTGRGKTTTVEGRFWRLNYYPQATATSKPSELQILRNFENAVKAQGGAVVNV